MNNRNIIAELDKKQDLMTLKLSGEIDLNTIKNVKPMLEEVHNEDLDLVIDLELCRFIDSTGLGAFVTLYKNQKSKDKNVKIINTQESVRKLFRLTNMEKMFGMEETQHDNKLW